MRFTGRLGYPGFLLFLLLFLTPIQAPAAEGTAHWGTTPAFTVTHAIPEPNPKRLRQVEGGLYELLYDTQVRLDGPTETTYRRRAYKVIDRSGLEAGAQIEITFDPAYESLVLHHVRIIRDGRAIDVSGEVNLDVIRKEEEIDNGILTGIKTALLRLPAVRVGDVIDAGWSWVSRPPLWPGHYFGAMQLEWSVPVGVTRYRVDLPAKSGLAVYRHRGAPGARRQLSHGRELLEWVFVDREPVVEDDDTPQWHRPWQRVALSTMPRWSAVAGWARPLYAGVDDFPAAWAKEVDRIAQASRSSATRAVEALRLVQDSIRYTSLSIGAGSFRPRSPAQVVRQGWGDCKDKAQLLVAVLRRLGIEAYPALTDTDEGAALPHKIPSPGAFDHVIVQIRIGGRSYWVDPTISHQGGDLAHLSPLTYRYALPIRPGQKALESIPLPLPVKPNLEATETYHFGAEGMRLDALTIYSGSMADSARADFASTARSEKETNFLRFYAASHPGLETRAPLAVEDDRKSNRFVVRESYWLPRQAYADDKLLETFPIHAVSLDQAFTYPEGGRRTHPLALTYPVNRTHKIVLTAADLTIPAPDEISIDNEAFSFSLDADRSGDTLTLLFSLAGKKPVLAAADFAEFQKDADTLATSLGWTLTLTPGLTSGGLAELALLAGFSLIVLFIVGVVHARKQRNAFRDEESFYPVPLRKFVPLSLASWGLYTIYWFWRNWHWVKQRLGDDILPFWRAFFGLFWLYPLFSRANGRVERPVPLWIGAVGSVLFFMWAVGTSIAERIDEDSFVPTAVGSLAGLFVVPAVVAVNRNNSPETVRSNGRFGWLGLAVLLLGPSTILLLLFV